MNAIRWQKLALLVVSASFLAPNLPADAVDIIYSGETPDSGYDHYSGTNHSDVYWDYVYELSATATNFGTFYWAIEADFAPVAIHGEDGNWVGTWDDEIQSDSNEYDNYFHGSYLEGQPGVVWEWTGHEPEKPPTGMFHFQSTWEPGPRIWIAVGPYPYDGGGAEWSSSPEPASMALSCLALLGVGYWRRRRATN